MSFRQLIAQSITGAASGARGFEGPRVAIVPVTKGCGGPGPRLLTVLARWLWALPGAGPYGRESRTRQNLLFAKKETLKGKLYQEK